MGIKLLKSSGIFSINQAMSRLRILVSALQSLICPSADRPASSLVLTSMLRQANLPYWSGRRNHQELGVL